MGAILPQMYRKLEEVSTPFSALLVNLRSLLSCGSSSEMNDFGGKLKPKTRSSMECLTKKPSLRIEKQYFGDIFVRTWSIDSIKAEKSLNQSHFVQDKSSFCFSLGFRNINMMFYFPTGWNVLHVHATGIWYSIPVTGENIRCDKSLTNPAHSILSRS